MIVCKNVTVMVCLYGLWRVARGHQCILVHIQYGDRTEQVVDAYAFVIVSLQKEGRTRR